MTKNVTICEVVTRDGFQSAPCTICADDKVRLIEMISDAGVKSIEVGAFSNYESMKKMRNTAEVFRKLVKHPDISYRALVFDPSGVQEAAECGCGKVKINISASEKHHKNGTGMDIRTALKGFEKIADIAGTYGIEMCGSISLPFRSPFPGEGLIEFDVLQTIIDEFYRIGIREISLSDSAGLGDPELIYNRFSQLMEMYPDVDWMLHMHNTYGMGLAGVAAALRAGVLKFDSSLAGLGGCPYIKGATGNIATEDLLYMFRLMNVETQIDLNKMILAGQFASKLAEYKNTDSYIQRIAASSGKGEISI